MSLIAKTLCSLETYITFNSIVKLGLFWVNGGQLQEFVSINNWERIEMNALNEVKLQSLLLILCWAHGDY